MSLTNKIYIYITFILKSKILLFKRRKKKV